MIGPNVDDRLDELEAQLRRLHSERSAAATALDAANRETVEAQRALDGAERETALARVEGRKPPNLAALTKRLQAAQEEQPRAAQRARGAAEAVRTKEQEIADYVAEHGERLRRQHRENVAVPAQVGLEQAIEALRAAMAAQIAAGNQAERIAHGAQATRADRTPEPLPPELNQIRRRELDIALMVTAPREPETVRVDFPPGSAEAVELGDLGGRTGRTMSYDEQARAYAAGRR